MDPAVHVSRQQDPREESRCASNPQTSASVGSIHSESKDWDSGSARTIERADEYTTSNTALSGHGNYRIHTSEMQGAGQGGDPNRLDRDSLEQCSGSRGFAGQPSLGNSAR